MLLALDIGNTQTVVGIYEGEKLLDMWRLSSKGAATADELRLKLLGLIDSAGISTDSITGGSLTSVASSTLAWKQAIYDAFGFEPFMCSVHNAKGFFQTNFSHASEIGADRVANAVAARALYGDPVIVVDFGTATSVEVVDKSGIFLGGIIAPGIETSTKALFSQATKLPSVDLIDPQSVIGKNTVHAMQAGIVYGEADRIDGLVRRMFAELGYEAPVVATGGLASTIAPLCQQVTAINSELTLEGLRLLYEAHNAD